MWLWAIMLDKWTLSHDAEKRYVANDDFNSILEGARNVPISAFIQISSYRVKITLFSNEKQSLRAI